MAGDHSAGVVEFWRSVELFDPQKVPGRDRIGPDAPPKVFDVPETGPLPWQAGHEAGRRDPGRDHEWRFTVYAGLFEMQGVQREIARVLGPGAPGEERGSLGETAMFSFAVGADGYLVEDSAVLSSSAWAVGRLRDPGPEIPDWLDGFDEEEKAFTRALNRLSVPNPGNGAAPSSTGRGQDSGSPGSGRDTGSVAHRAVRAVGRHVGGAAVEAVNEGAKTVGGMVTGVATATVTGVAGPLVGGYAGSVAGKFAEQLLTINGRGSADPAAARADEDEGAAHVTEASPGTVMTGEYLGIFVRELARALHIDESLAPSGIRVEMTAVRIRDDEGKRSGGSALLNSFIRDDLGRIARALRDGDAGPALHDYLTPDERIDDSRRIDTRQDGEAVLAAVAPTERPAGRWPVERDRPLAIGQQLAVNRIMADLVEGAGVSTVNGPPGTGKTTLLRDVVAAVVVRRAERLVELPDPRDAFAGGVSYQENGQQWSVWTLRPELTGSEMVVATNSNSAAENVTRELPLASEDDLQRLRQLDYFADIAGELADKPAWGLTSAALGKRENGRKFTDIFWWPARTEAVPGLLARLGDAVGNPAPYLEEWASAGQAFRAARRQVEELTAERRQVADALSRHTAYPARRRLLDEQVQAREVRLGDDGHRLRDAERAHDQARGRLAEAESDLTAHEASAPGWWTRLVTFGRASREWKGRRSALAESKRAGVAEEVAAAGRRRAMEEAVAAARAELARADHALEELDRTEEQDARLVEDARSRWPRNLPVDPSEPGFDRSAPWADEDIEIARANLCEAAFRLHRAFVLAAARQIRPALIAANKIIGGGMPLGRDVARAAWQAFFLVVPVVSTTFASLPRLFADLGREDLGWLLVDEAGQATVQSVVGGMWRARRAVLVGDPMQLEPIVPLPVPAQIALADRFGVDHQWLPERRSAQVVADRLTRFGTEMTQPDSDERLWVGAPLRVHRRCDKPMFDIANDVAYADSPMVFATTERPARALRPSQWIDVRGPAGSNVVRAEIAQLDRLVAELRGDGCRPDEILVLAPFRGVVAAARGCLRGRLDTRRNVGTVHTVQGKQAPVVILVLGGGSGARTWAASRPNLLNVAVSRAQERFYVIGDHADWSRRRFFSVAARRLEVWEPPT